MVILSSALAFMVSSAVSRAEACAPTPAIHPRSALVSYFNLSRSRSAGPDDQEALPCRDQTRKRIALVHPLAAPSWTAPANHLSIRRNHGSPVVSTRVLQHIRRQSGHGLSDGAGRRHSATPRCG